VQYLSPAGNRLAAPLNRVSVRFVAPGSFKLRQGVVEPVAEHVARQMRAAQVLRLSRAVARGETHELQQVDLGQAKLREYLQLLDQQTATKMVSEMEAEYSAVRAASPAAKKVMGKAFMAQRFMRDLDDH
jgi:hypothetical protein